MDALRKSALSKESAWDLMNAPGNPFAAGNSCPRTMLRTAAFRPGSRSRLSSASSRQFFSYGVAFSSGPYDFAQSEFALDPQASAARGGGPPRKRTGIGVLD